MPSRFEYLQHERSGLKFGAYTIVCIILLTAIGLRITQGLEMHMDILLWDEANYLNRGLWMFHKIPRVWGPSYSAWYKFLSYIEPDKISLYYLNYRVMTIATAVAGFLFLSTCGVRQWVALLLCSFLLLSSFNLPVWPKISHYCILVVMLAVVLSKYIQEALAKWCVFLLAFLICAYSRPELYLSFIICFLITLFIACFRFKKSKISVRLFFIATILWIIFIGWYYKSPFNSGDTGRSIKVFYQHFSMNYIQWNHLKLTWWLDFPEIIAKNFKHSESVSSIIKYDGPLFWKHVLSNIKNYVYGIGSLTGQFFIPFTLKKNIPVVLGALGGLLYLFPIRSNGFSARLKSILGENLVTFCFLLIFTLPSLLVCIYAYPRAHYLVINIPLLLLLLGILLTALQGGQENIKRWMAVCLGTALFICSPKADSFDFYQLERHEKSLANVQTLKYLQQQQPADTLHIFDLEGDLSAMLAGKYKGYTNAYLMQQPVSVAGFIEKNNIDIIYVTPVLLNYGPIRRDTAFERLLKSPESHNFYPEKTGNFTPYLLIRKRQ